MHFLTFDPYNHGILPAGKSALRSQKAPNVSIVFRVSVTALIPKPFIRVIRLILAMVYTAPNPEKPK